MLKDATTQCRQPDNTNVTSAKPWTAKGYPRLAQLMGAYTEVAIFRRFGSLNTLSVLSLQAELVELEDKYKQCVERDNQSENSRDLSEDFYTLHESNSGQKDLLDKIRVKLKEYSGYHKFMITR